MLEARRPRALPRDRRKRMLGMDRRVKSGGDGRRSQGRGGRTVSVIGELASFVAERTAVFVAGGGARAAARCISPTRRLRRWRARTFPKARRWRISAMPHRLADRIGRRAAAIRLTEIDDIHLPSCTTPSAGVVPVALLLAHASQNFDPGGDCRRDVGRHRDHDPHRHRGRRAANPLSRHLADLSGGAGRGGRDSGASVWIGSRRAPATRCRWPSC